MCKHYDIKITGKVQGVWCRKYIKDKARELDIKGFTQNLPDGSVFVEAESDNLEHLKTFIDWLSVCSPHSKVEKVIIINEKECKSYVDFQIRK